MTWPRLPKFPDFGPVPAGRDVAVDVVRSWSLTVVVLGHFLMQITWWPAGGVPMSSNTLASGTLWPFATWLFQVMPLFFLAGGAVNRGSWMRSQRSWPVWMRQRMTRLMRPTVVFLASMGVLFTIVTLLVPRDVTGPLVSGISGPLWFLAVYVPVTALTPVTARWHERRPWLTVSGLLVAVVVVDVLRLNVAEAFGAVNLLLAWVLVHQFGYWFADGVPRRAGWALVGVGLVGNVVLTQLWGVYPTSLVGIPTEEFSNMAPPTVVLVLHAVTLFGLLVLVAPALRRWFASGRLARATAIAGVTAMSLYLWHMLVLVAWTAVCHVAGWQMPVRVEGVLVVPDGPQYWLWLAPSLAVYAGVVWLLVRCVWRLEFARVPLVDARGPVRDPSVAAAVCGVVLVSLGLLVVSGEGFSGFPVAVSVAFGVPVSAAAGVAAVGVGVWLVRGRRERVPVDHVEAPATV